LWAESFLVAKEATVESHNEAGTEHRNEHHHEGERGHKKEVTVTVDGKHHKVPEGAYLVSELKTRVGVDPNRELDEVVHGEFKPLDDNKHIDIKGGEIFVSHARQGGSS
jgi:hypothetical protein